MINITEQELSDYIKDIYGSVLNRDWNNIMEQLRFYTNSNKALFLQNFSSEQPPILALTANFNFPEHKFIEYQKRLHEDPFYLHTVHEPTNQCINCNDYFNIEDYENDDYYQSVCVPLRAHYVLANMLEKDGENESVVILNRSKDQEPYSQQDINLVNLVSPHLTQALFIYKELKLYKNYANISKSILDQQDKAVMVCDEHSRIVLSNDYANARLADSTIIKSEDNKLILKEHVYQKHLDKCISQCAQLSYKEICTQESLVIEVDENDKLMNILITVSPLKSNNAFVDIDVPCCMVTISFQQQLNWQLVQREYSLTPRELELLKAIYAKKKLTELTVLLGAKYNTLRVHLQNIFKKLDVSSQTELMIKINLFR